jgi:hypothetical protein
MKTVVIVRTLDEEINIARFCRCYAGADKILIADGGSVDRTLEIAAGFPNVEIRHFRQRTFYGNGVFFNPEGSHINFLIDWAVLEHAPDWLIFDDCDCVPTEALWMAMFDILAATESLACAYKLYVFGEDEYLPLMSLPGQCLWAWRPGELPGVRADESIPETQFGFVGVPPKRARGRVDLSPPFVLLHYFAPTPAERARKMARYAARGTPQVQLRQTEYWPPQPLPAWARPPRFGDGVEETRKPLKLIKANVVRCNHCAAFVEKVPKWKGGPNLGEGLSCGRCGGTSMIVYDGRPFNPRTPWWGSLVAEFWKLVAASDDPSYLEFLWATVETEE